MRKYTLFIKIIIEQLKYPLKHDTIKIRSIWKWSKDRHDKK